jgi:uncharacterized protein YjiS (DUF1127 family)
MNPLSLALRRADPLLPLTRLQAWLRDALHRHRRLADARAATAMLSQLDARTLRDIGLDRSEISSAAWELSGFAPRERRATRDASVR